LFEDYEIIYRDEYDGLSLLDVRAFRRITIVPNTTYSNINAANYEISADKKFVLLAHDSQKVRIKEIFILTFPLKITPQVSSKFKRNNPATFLGVPSFLLGQIHNL